MTHIRRFADLPAPAADRHRLRQRHGHRRGQGPRRPVRDRPALRRRSTARSPTTRPTRSRRRPTRPCRRRCATGGYDFGIAFDGDADRVGFVDETGRHHPHGHDHRADRGDDAEDGQGRAIFYDLRSSWAVKEVIEENGGRPMMSRVGHAFIKQQMRDANAVFAGELSGHYYFRTTTSPRAPRWPSSASPTWSAQSDQPLSELISPIQRYHASGEINSEVADPEAVFAAPARDVRRTANVLELDGLSVEFDDWWFNVRPVQHRAADPPEPRGQDRGRDGTPPRRGPRPHPRLAQHKQNRTLM